MRFDALTLFPEFFEVTRLGVTARAFRDLGHEIHTHSYRPFAGNATGRVDGSPFGGGPGMVLRPEVLKDALASIPRSEKARVIHFSPAAPPFRHADAKALASLDQVILVCTRYEGLDQRAADRLVDQEFSVGEAVLSGGELPALFLMDAVCRLLPGVLGNEASAEEDSFATGLLDHPHYTRDHEAIRLWRLREAMARTKRLRPDLWVAYLTNQVPTLPKADQWAAWQVEHPEDGGRAKAQGWKGWLGSV